MDIFSSNGASLLVLLVQGLFAWALWSLRRAFVRTEDYALHVQRDARREAATARRLGTLEEHQRLTPDTADMAGLHNELAALRGEIQALNARITGLDRLLAPSLSFSGSGGSYTLRYKVAAVDANGRQSLPSPAGECASARHPSDWVVGNSTTISW